MTDAAQRSQREQRKQRAAQAALAEVEPLLAPDCIVGVGTGSTADCFIDALAALRSRFAATVSSSQATTARLEALSVPVIDLNAADAVAVYVDGADEVNAQRVLVKGGGGALTREKIVAAAAERFVCIVDDSKRVAALGAFPLPMEVIPMACRSVLRAIRDLGGEGARRADFRTDNGNCIVDATGLPLDDPGALETALNGIPGVVENGLFAARRPDVVLVGTASGVEAMR